MTDLNKALRTAIHFIAPSIDIPPDVWKAAIKARVFAGKADGDLASINATYHDAITATLTTYFEGGSITAPRNQFRMAMIEAFDSAFGLGWVDGGQELLPDSEAAAWFDARVEAELGHIEMLFQQAKELRKEEDFDFFEWITARADGYTRTLKEIYNAAKMRASEDIMVTFDGDDGAESCEDCQKLKGKRHKISWFIKRNYIPPYGTGLQCHIGGHCQHGLMDDNGNWVTV